MINLAISLAVYILVAGLLQVATDLQPWLNALVGLLAFGLVYFLLSRRVLKKLTAVMETVQRDMMAGRADKAIKTLEATLPLGKWQFLVTSQLYSQIGSLHYLKRDFGKAFDFLQKGFGRHWPSMGMLAICYMKRNKTDKMIQTFEKAVSLTRNEPLLWNLYAYCLEKIGKHSQAIEVMKKGLKKTGNDENLQENLDALVNGRKMKMQIYGDAWLQFHLEKTGAIVKKQTKAVQGRRKIVRR
ncbi:tetratricopeptide repeat protein [Syntrophotalea acetylenica]|jgi:tetratricopeptide (TPR) repeat protein|uniref:tetratricopeptide repeat protein n=1 Tax=Syntrophotalea acetylenica TaxID=29542 RepID=UPI002A359C41|nr:tetratricopeptide repeat protein [Syntrophotalea acetylenica]MDY0261097.1 tetratricopeptide repeat protein [Syntrophotalea acetylenica]